MVFTQHQQQNYVYSKHAIKMLLKMSFRKFLHCGWSVLTKSGHSPKYPESHVLSGLHVSLCLQNVTFSHSFCKWKHVSQAGPDLQFVLVVRSIYDSHSTFLFLVGAEGPANLSKLKSFHFCFV